MACRYRYLWLLFLSSTTGGLFMLLFLSSFLTLAEAKNPSVDHQALVTQRETRARDLARVVGQEILLPVDSEDMMVIEVVRMAGHVRDAFLDGRITLVEARYADRRKLAGKAFDQFCLIGRVPRASKSARSPVRRHRDPETEALIVAAEAQGLSPVDARLFRLIPLGPPHIVADYLGAITTRKGHRPFLDDND